MTEQLRITKERSLAKPLKLVKPVGVAIGACMAFLGCADLFVASNNINDQLDRDFPLTVREEVQEAQREILVFENEVLKRNISGQTNPQTIQAIDVAEQKKQRALNKRELESQATPRQVLLIFGGTAIELVTIFAPAPFPALRRRNEIHKETS